MFRMNSFIAAPGIAFAQSAGDPGIGGVDRSGSPSERTRQDMTNAPRGAMIDYGTTASVNNNYDSNRGYDSGSNSGMYYQNPIDRWAADQAQQLEDNQ